MPGIGNAIALGFGGSINPAIALLSDGNTVAWFDYTKGITKNGSNQISAWADQSGLGHNLLQAVDLNKPLDDADGPLFDGGVQFLKASTFTWGSPITIYLVVKQITWTSDRIFDGNTPTSGTLFQYDATPKLSIFEGAHIITSGATTPLNAWMIVRVVFNGGSSSLQINSVAAVPGTMNTITLAGLDLGAGAARCNFQIKEFIGRNVADTPTNNGLIYSYLKSRYSL